MILFHLLCCWAPVCAPFCVLDWVIELVGEVLEFNPVITDKSSLILLRTCVHLSECCLKALEHGTLWIVPVIFTPAHNTPHLIAAVLQQQKLLEIMGLRLWLNAPFFSLYFWSWAVLQIFADLSLHCSKVGQCLISQSESSALCASILKTLENGTKQ